MQFSVLLTSTLAALVAANYRTVVNDAKAIQKQITTLNDTLNAFHGDISNGLKLLSVSNDLQDALNKAQQDVEASPAFGDHSQDVVNALAALSNPTFSLLDNLVAKKPILDKKVAGLVQPSSIVKKELPEEESTISSFGDAVAAKVSDNFKPLVPQAIAIFKQHFDAAIAAFNN